MTQDARQSLIAFVSVTVLFAFFVIALPLSRGFVIPRWVLLLGLVLTTTNFVWRGVQWLQSKRNGPQANGR
jgi:protein-S-isoprenylcysteine O-methyltransferase Ste14